VRWRVVEQPGFVAVGQAEFADGVLSFHPTLDDAGPAPAVLFSSVLQYIENPHAILEEVARRGYRHVIVDRTGFSRDGRDRITVQYTPPALGGASYPCRIFDQARLLEPLKMDYILTKEWLVEFDQLDRRVDYRGFYFQRRRANPS
jgi:putative methyltransferase (TIGR04325 family)